MSCLVWPIVVAFVIAICTHHGVGLKRNGWGGCMKYLIRLASVVPTQPALGRVLRTGAALQQGVDRLAFKLTAGISTKHLIDPIPL